MSTRRAVRFAAFAALPLIASGCLKSAAELGRSPLDQSGSGPFGPPESSRLLQPLAGKWAFDKDATREARLANGESQPDADARSSPSEEDSTGDDAHSDMTITGNEAVCAGSPPAEYRFFAIHRHDGKICGKAWHHEDRFDPGDMSKCYFRFWSQGDRLCFAIRMMEATVDVSDPDLSESAPIELDSDSNCNADSPSGEWSPWSTYVFNRTKPQAR